MNTFPNASPREKEYASREDQLRRRIARPLSPGQVVAGLLEEMELSQTELAARLRVSRATVNELVNERRGLSADMAHRLGRFFGNGPAPWLRMQDTLDLWDALRMDTSTYDAIEPHAMAA